MIILIYGDDSFRVSQKVKQIKSAFAEKFDKSGLNTQSFPVEGSSKLDPGEILQASCSFPFLGEKRMTVIRSLIDSVNKTEQNVWVDGFSRMPESTIAVFWEIASAKQIERKSLFKELTKMSEVHIYTLSELKGAQLNRWVTDRITESGGRIEQNALRSLIERVGSDLWQMSHEIEKLIAFADDHAISSKMVDELVKASFEGRIFDLMDAISKKQSARAIQLLEQERWSGSNDHYVLTMIGRQIRILISASSMLNEDARVTKHDLASSAGIHPFVAQKALEQARGFTFSDLQSAHNLLFDYDHKLKTGRISAGLAVDLVTEMLLN